jgi:hypothetical protein
LKHLDAVLGMLQDNTLFVKLSKCSFGVLEIEYLGHVVTGQGVSMDRQGSSCVELAYYNECDAVERIFASYWIL